MAKNYAYEAGSFMALAKMFRDAVREMNAAEGDSDRDWAARRLNLLCEQTNDTLVELGYQEVSGDD